MLERKMNAANKILILLIFIFLPTALFSKNYVEGELIVKYKEWVKPHHRKEILERHKLNVIKEFPHLRLNRLRIPKGKNVEDFIGKLKKERHIEYVEPNYKRNPFYIPKDTDFEKQWNLTKIKMEQAWDAASGSQDIIIAVIDTGIDYTHPDLKKNIWKNPNEIPGNGIDDDGNGFIDDVYGYDFCKFYSNGACHGEDNDPMDTHGHGTLVAGVIGAITDNSIGVAGINQKISIMAVKFMDSAGDVASEIEALEYAAKMGAKIINASYGDKGYSQAEKEVIEELGKKGIIFVCASGNDGKNVDSEPLYPASYNLPNMIIVGATTKEDTLSNFSNFGSIVHIGAPGETIYSTASQLSSNFQSAFIKKKDNSQIKGYGLEYAGLTKGINAALVFCGKATKDEIPDEVSGKIALIERGNITFREKVLNVMEKGAIGAIIYNDVGTTDLFYGTLNEEGDYIPVISISKIDGEYLKSITDPVTLVNYPFSNVSGTSIATPHVSATAALLLSLKPDADYLTIKETILMSADIIPELQGKIENGRRLNAYNALMQLKSTMSAFHINLKKGWNFISVPLSLYNKTIDDIFVNIKPRVIYGYDGLNKKWLRYRDKGNNELSGLEAGHGYWVYMAEEIGLDLYGKNSDNKVRLYQGWNLIGFGGVDNKPIEVALDSLKDKWIIVWSWEDGIWYAKANGFSVPFPSLERFKNGKAYWILLTGVNEEGTEWQQ